MKERPGSVLICRDWRLQRFIRDYWKHVVFGLWILISLFHHFQHISAKTRTEQERTGFVNATEGSLGGALRGAEEAIVVIDLKPKVDNLNTVSGLLGVERHLRRCDWGGIGHALKPRVSPLHLHGTPAPGIPRDLSNVKNYMYLPRWNVSPVFNRDENDLSIPIDLGVSINNIGSLRNVQSVFGGLGGALGSICLNDCLSGYRPRLVSLLFHPIGQVFGPVGLRLHVIGKVLRRFSLTLSNDGQIVSIGSPRPHFPKLSVHRSPLENSDHHRTQGEEGNSSSEPYHPFFGTVYAILQVLSLFFVAGAAYLLCCLGGWSIWGRCRRNSLRWRDWGTGLALWGFAFGIVRHAFNVAQKLLTL